MDIDYFFSILRVKYFLNIQGNPLMLICSDAQGQLGQLGGGSSCSMGYSDSKRRSFIMSRLGGFLFLS